MLAFTVANITHVHWLSLLTCRNFSLFFLFVVSLSFLSVDLGFDEGDCSVDICIGEIHASCDCSIVCPVDGVHIDEEDD